LFSAGGLLLGTLFFAAALTPTLLPRNFVTQGVLSGLSLAAGYGIGVFGHWLWTYMELPHPKDRLLRIAKLAAAIGCTVVAVVFLWRSAQWQNSIRELMQLEPVDSGVSARGRSNCAGGFRNPDGARVSLPADIPVRGDTG
jgi:uncharacterized membrane protein